MVPETIAISLPFVFRSVEHMHHVLDGPIGDEILAAMSSTGHGRAGLLRQRRALHLHPRRSRSRGWPTSRA